MSKKNGRVNRQKNNMTKGKPKRSLDNLVSENVYLTNASYNIAPIHPNNLDQEIKNMLYNMFNSGKPKAGLIYFEQQPDGKYKIETRYAERID